MNGGNGGSKRGPHRITDLTNLLTSPPETEGPRRARAVRRDLPPMYAQYALEFHALHPGYPADFVRWYAKQEEIVTPTVRRSSAALNPLIGSVLDDPEYAAIEPVNVLVYLVRHWDVIRQNVQLKLGPVPYPEQITKLCRLSPAGMHAVLMGLFGRRLQLYLERQMRLISMTNGPEDERINLVYLQLRRLLASVPVLLDEDFVDSLAGVMFGRQLQ